MVCAGGKIPQSLASTGCACRTVGTGYRMWFYPVTGGCGPCGVYRVWEMSFGCRGDDGMGECGCPISGRWRTWDWFVLGHFCCQCGVLSSRCSALAWSWEACLLLAGAICMCPWPVVLFLWDLMATILSRETSCRMCVPRLWGLSWVLCQ